MSEHDDVSDWVEQTANFTSTSSKSLTPLAFFDEDEMPRKKNSGSKNQYALYAGGYTATTKTIQTLPAGIYDIKVDQTCVHVTPALPPTGLLFDLPEMRSNEVIKTVEIFWNSEKDYKEGNDFVVGGAAYKSGIMLYGPPGSGKSSTIKIVCQKLVDRGGTVFFSGTDPHWVSNWLQDFATIEPHRKTIVILEDIDSLIQSYGESRYLEMLDSAKTIDNVLFIATTNYPEKLDPRIYNRPGRFSHVIKIGYPNKEMRRAYLNKLLKDHRDVDYIVNNSDGFTVDHLNSLCNSVYREKKDVSSELKRLRILFKIKPSSDEDKEKIGI